MASAFSRALASAAQAFDRRVGWYRLPRLLAIPTLIELRNALRANNLYDTGLPDASKAPPPHGDHRSTRTLDGTFNDLERPLMGSIGARFGRNVPLEDTWPEPASLEPNPRVVSRELLTRTEFIPAGIVNVLGAAWLQFEVHDWFSHGKGVPEDPWELELDEADPWAERPMRIQRTRRDPTYSPDSGEPPTYVTADSHWWDGSQIYGSTVERANRLRAHEDGKLRLDVDGLLPRDLDEGVDLRDVAGNFWIGLGVLHTLFTLEHNAICERLRSEYR